MAFWLDTMKAFENSIVLRLVTVRYINMLSKVHIYRRNFWTVFKWRCHSYQFHWFFFVNICIIDDFLETFYDTLKGKDQLYQFIFLFYCMPSSTANRSWENRWCSNFFIGCNYTAFESLFVLATVFVSMAVTKWLYIGYRCFERLQRR